MDSSNAPGNRRQNNKRDFSTMSASHQDDSAFGLPRDSHYDNEHASQRRRIEPDTQTLLPWHYPGDGLDFRRPVMSSSSTTAGGYGRTSSRERARTAVDVIDLTDEDGVQEQVSQSTTSQSTAAGASTRAQRLPRFGRNVIDIESSSDDDNNGNEGGGSERPNLPGNHNLALPNGRARPQFSSLRRPARPPSPPTDMEEVEFLEERPRPRMSVHSRQPTPAVRNLRQRSATPYPTAFGETIDLTEENDDDIVHLNTRQREGGGVNNDRPVTPPWRLQNRGYEQMAHVANLLREGGANLGGRLMQRLQGVAGFDGEFHRAPWNAAWNQNRNPTPDNARGHDNHPPWNPQAPPPVDHRRDRRPYDRNGRPRHTANRNRRQQEIRITQQMPGLMDYAMTGFDLGLAGGYRPPTPKYTPPSPPEKGFTRSPEEEEVVVCPNCGDELAMGESEIKQEVWVVKACGHAYCGECVHNRIRNSTKKGKGKGKAPVVDDDASLPPPFKKCVVPGCGKQLNAKSLVHVYLNT